jgi:hypothetical protein
MVPVVMIVVMNVKVKIILIAMFVGQKNGIWKQLLILSLKGH